LDKGSNILPAGAIGELVVGGDGVASGYLNREELTRERFIPDPLFPERNMYKTGDLVHMLSDGSVDYLGRIDRQVKIHGFRIELEEIEYALRGLDFIKQAVVQVRNFGDEKYICAYFTADKDVDADELKRILKKILPGYMVPSFYTQLVNMPINVTGKINSACLPVPQFMEPEVVMQKVMLNDLELAIAETCAAVVGVDVSKIEVDTNFFDLGITSLSMMSINNRLNKKLKKSIPLAVLFECNTVSKLRNYLENEISDGSIAIKEDEKAAETERNRLIKTSMLIRRMEGDQ
jgi:acyl carrier protein